ncbi:AMP-binding protein [Bifidobacterium sp. ESL0764]|uniref:AMP-binding protein n=1 Tax=Bifidobacterium sp. ESL0764 TaxID=2983228 RepID=UPI0023F619E8|nr:AMP-binding protein [Bifidobacterium sp. ESL0764]WEV65750.1 AMP-binding protein [Bifidobacterium sp. ESL0764]
MDNWVLKRAELTPDRLAVDDGETRCTFREVFERARALGAVLDRFGAFKTRNVALVSDNDLRGYLMAVTLLLYGKTVVWLNKRLTNDELARQMSDAEVACCLKDDSLPVDLLSDKASGETGVRVLSFDQVFAEAGRLKADGLHSSSVGADATFNFEAGAGGVVPGDPYGGVAEAGIVDNNGVDVHGATGVVDVASVVGVGIGESDVEGLDAAAAAIPREFADDQVVSVMFTSGSTGAPKGIQQTVRNHFTSATSVALNLGTSPCDEWLCAVPIFHISGYSIILRGLIFGVTVRLMNHFDAGEMERILTDEPVTWVSVVPTMLKQLVPVHERRMSVDDGFSSVPGAVSVATPDSTSVGVAGMESSSVAETISGGVTDTVSGLSSDMMSGATRNAMSDTASAPMAKKQAAGALKEMAPTRLLPADFGYSPAFKGFILGGEKSDLALLKRCHKLGMVVVRSYGMTETCSQIVGTGTADGARKLLSSGKPYFTTSLKLAERTDEILIKTDALTPGYLNRPGALEAKKTADGWYKTGDVGHFDADGYLYVDGRLDNMMISGGEHVFPEEVERVYADCPGISEIAVTSEPDETWGEVPVAYVVCKSGKRQDGSVPKEAGAVDAAAVESESAFGAESDKAIARTVLPASAAEAFREFGRARLAHYKVPKRFYRVDSLPKTSTGKVRRFLLGKGNAADES